MTAFDWSMVILAVGVTVIVSVVIAAVLFR